MDDCLHLVITGTPDNEDVGDYTVTVKVTDSAGESDTKTFTLTVNNVNDAPEFTFTAPSSTDEDAAFSYRLTAIDVDMSVDVDEMPTFEAVSKPDWMSVSQVGTVPTSPTLVNETTYRTQYFPKVAALEDVEVSLSLGHNLRMRFLCGVSKI